MNDALTRRPSQPLARPVGRGKENIAQEDVTLPRLALAQKTSPQLEPDKPEYIEGLKLFQLFNTATKQNYGSGPVEFVIIRMDKRGMQFDANNNVVDFNVPIGDPRLEWTTGPDGQRIKPEATLFYDFLIILLDSKQPAVLSLKGTGIKTAKAVNNMLLMRRNGDAWEEKFQVSAGKASGAFSYGIYLISPAKGEVPPDILQLAEETYEALAGRVFHTERDSDRDRDDLDPSAVPF